MKIRSLRINRFGHFHECDLDFPGDGLQVIYGPNEAGKTTLLEFLRGLLFDFPVRTPYDFGGHGEMAGVAQLELQDGREVELRRRKGNKDKVSIKIDGTATELGEDGWLKMLDHADRTLFESVFAFGLDQLSKGEASLKHESMQSALFGGSLGGTTSPDKVVADLEGEAEKLFKRGGSKPIINALLIDLKRLTKDLKDRSLRPDNYQQAVDAATKAAEQAKTLHHQLAALRREHAQIGKRVRAWPKWWELQQRHRERAELGSLPPLAANARQAYVDLGRTLKTLEAERAQETTEIELSERERAALRLDPLAVSFRAEIASCLELRQSFIEARDQLPDRRRQREQLQQQIDRELQELRPGWSHVDLREFTVDAVTRAEIDRVIKERHERRSDLTKLSARRDGDAANLHRAREELETIGASTNVTALAGIVADEAAYAADRQQLEKGRVELAKLQRKLTMQVRALTPPLPAETPEPEALCVPRVQTVVEFQTRHAGLAEQLRVEQLSAAKDEGERKKVDEALAAAQRGRAVPSLEERDAARANRNVAWTLIRSRYINPETADARQLDAETAAWLKHNGAVLLPDGYEQAVRQADGLADQIYDQASEVAIREESRRRLEEITARLKEKRAMIAAVEGKQATLQAEWVSLWEPCGFVPLTPEAMRGWLEQHATVCVTISECGDRAAELTPLQERIQTFEQRLRAAYGLATEDVSGMLVAARKAVEHEREGSRRTVELQKEIRRLENQLAKYDDELRALQSLETAADTEWNAVLSRLNLPAEWDAEVARTVIDKLKTTRVRLDGLPVEDERIGAMEGRVEEFDRRVRALCETLAPELLDDPAELAVKKVDEQVERAAEAQRKHEQLSQKLAHLHQSLESRGSRLRQAEADRERLFASAAASTEEQFLEVVASAEQAARLDREIDQLRREVELIRAGDDPAEFEHSLSTSEFSLLQSQEHDLNAAVQATEAARKKADGDEALARAALRQLDGSEEAAKLGAEQASKRSQLVTEVDRYMPLIYAKHLLKAAVSRFEKENQPEMIATVSRLLREMTGGRYVEFDRSSGGKQSILVRRSDGAERTPDQMSTGTREQLYLAIRLAYVLHYCDHNQPLPIVIDDVLVNFDEARSRQTLAVLAEISYSAQVLFFTCHPHMVKLACEIVPGLRPIELGKTMPPRPTAPAPKGAGNQKRLWR